MPTNAEKQAIWDSYQARRPIRVPLRWNVNSRIVVLNPDLNPEGWRYEQVFRDPDVALRVQARFQEYVATTLSPMCDSPTGLPDAWTFSVECQNTYDAAFFGAPIRFHPGQVPSAEAFLTLGDVREFLDMDFSRPLENPWVQDRLSFHAALVREARSFEYRGRKGNVAPFGVLFDGPLTVAAMLFGSDSFTLLAEDPELATQVLEKITRACIVRNQALAQYAGGGQKPGGGFLADDSIQLISQATYETMILPLHELWYAEMSDTTPTRGPRCIHLCGDATRHYRRIRDSLGVYSFDTGFPVDHGALRRELGADVEICGGPRVDLLQSGSPSDCAAEARRILQSGIMDGGRFVLQEANNLPPKVPLENLAAVYECCQEFGRYPPPL